MRKWLFILFLGTSLVYAANISAPPPLSDIPFALQHYLREIYEQFPDIGGIFRLKTDYQTSAITAGNETVILVSGTVTVTLPDVAEVKNRIYYIKNVGAGTVTVDGNAADTIDDSTTATLAANEAIEIISDETEWWIISNKN